MNPIEQTAGPGRLALRLPAAHSLGRQARRLLREFAETRGVAGRDLETLEFVAGEMIDNAVDHGGGGGAREVSDLPREVRLAAVLELESGAWRLRVDDQGGGDPAAMAGLIAPPDGIPDLEDDRGRGLFLLAQMVESLTVERSPDGTGLSFTATACIGQDDGTRDEQ